MQPRQLLLLIGFVLSVTCPAMGQGLTFQQEEADGAFHCATADLDIGFASPKEGMRIVSLRQPETGTEFMLDGGIAQTLEVDVLMGSDPAEKTILEFAKATVQKEEKTGDVVLVYTGTVPDEKASATVTIRLNADERGLAARLSATSKGCTLAAVRFPVLTNLGRKDGDDPGDALLLPYSIGRLARTPSKLKRNYVWPSATYPGRAATMQWLGYQRAEGATLYLGTDDSEGFAKEFLAYGQTPEPGLRMHITHYPEETGMVSRYRWRYPIRLAGVAGDWFDAARFYRAWAIKQFWVKQGALRYRHDSPDWWRGPVIHVMGNAGSPGYLVKNVQSARTYTDLPLITHFAFWFPSTFDDNYPDYFPARPHVKDDVAAIHALGAYSEPYINGTLWDIDTPSFAAEGAIRYAKKQRNGALQLQGWHGQNHATMCPWTPFWQKKVLGICKREIQELGFKCLYLDQIGASGPTACYDSTHGHLRGMGNHHAMGYWQLLEGIQTYIDDNKLDVAITTEDNAETVIGGVDGCLMSGGADYGDAAPLFQVVYHDFSTIFTRSGRQWSVKADDPPTAMRLQTAELLVWGAQLGYFRDIQMGRKKYEDADRFLAKLGLWRKRGLSFLAYGTMQRPLALTGGDTFRCRWGYAPPWETERPSVLNGVFEAEDGTLGIVLVNYRDSERTVRFKVPRAGTLVELLLPDGEKPVAPGQNGEIEVTVPAEDCRLFEIMR